jgi:hypothetical protein
MAHELASSNKVDMVSTTAGGYRGVTSPLTPDMLAPLPDDCDGIDFEQPLTDDEYRQVAALLEQYPDKRLYALQMDSTRQTHITDLKFLQFFPHLRRFSCNLEMLQTLEGIEHLKQPDEIRIFKPVRKISAAPLTALTALDVLWLDGQYSDRDALRELTGVTNFKMGYAAKLPNLGFLPPNLARFSMNLGSVTDISALNDLPYLQRLSFHKVHGIADLTPLSRAIGLETLYLAHLNKVTDLFDMSTLTDLTDLTVSAMPKLTDLRPVLTAPNLSNLTVYDLPALDAASWRETCTTWLAQGKPPFWE